MATDFPALTDRNVQHPNRVQLTPVNSETGGGTYDAGNIPGTVTAEGTEPNATWAVALKAYIDANDLTASVATITTPSSSMVVTTLNNKDGVNVATITLPSATTTAAGVATAAQMTALASAVQTITASGAVHAIKTGTDVVVSVDTASADTAGVVKIGDNIAVANGVASIPTATDDILGVAKAGANLTVSGGAFAVPTATSSTAGVVRPDGTSINISSGLISVPTATTGVLGIAKPDGVTISATNGVLTAYPFLQSATAAGQVATWNGSKYTGTTHTHTLNGVQSATPSWYAPTAAGTAGQVLTSTGGIPTWNTNPVKVYTGSVVRSVNGDTSVTIWDKGTYKNMFGTYPTQFIAITAFSNGDQGSQPSLVMSSAIRANGSMACEFSRIVHGLVRMNYIVVAGTD